MSVGNTAHYEVEIPSTIVMQVEAQKPLETPEQIEMYIRAEAQKRSLDADLVVKVAKCESSLNARIRGDSGLSRGIWQIFAPAHPTITDEQAFDVVWSTNWALDNMKAGKWNMWTCYNNR